MKPNIEIYTTVQEIKRKAADNPILLKYLREPWGIGKVTEKQLIRQVLGLYSLKKTPEQISAILRIPVPQTIDILKKHAGVKDKPLRKTRPKKAAFFTWVRNHPGIDIPDRLQEAARITGIPPIRIMYAIRVRREKFISWVESLGEIRNENLFFYTLDGKRVYHKAVKTLRFFYNPYKDRTAIEAITILGEPLVIPVYNRWNFRLLWITKAEALPSGELT